MEMYFIKSAACLAVLLIFYKLMLEKENMHVFKRYYLLSSVLAALVIPFITFITYVEPSSEKFNALIYTSEISSETTSVKPDLSYIFYGIYLVGFLFFSVKFIRNLRDLLVKIRTNPKVSAGSFINVLLSEKVQPHTFFSFIFFNKEKYLKNEIPQDVKIHEQAHARQKHSLDVIFIELLQIIFWFNPLIFLLKDAVKLNHEFLADREVIQNGITTSTYQQTLLAYSSRDLQSVLVNPINYSSIKKRFTVMKTKTSRKTIWARGLLLLPLAVGLLYGFSTKEVVEKNMKDSRSIVGSYEILELTVDKKGQYFLNNVKMSLREIENLGWENYSDFSINAAATAPQESIQELVELIMAKRTEKEGKISVCTYGESGGEDSVLNKIFKPVQQDKATPEMIAEYNRLVNKLNETGVINQKDLDRFNIISRAMTAEQKKNSVQPKFKMAPIINDEKVVQVKEKATPEMINEYNRLVKHYNALPRDKDGVKQEDANRIMSILSSMTPEQKSKAEKIRFDVPPPPPTPAPAPNEKLPAPPPPPAKNKDGLRELPAPPAPNNANMKAPPPPPNYADLVEKSASFYYNGNKITPEEARKLVEVEKKVNIQITDIDKNPIVRLTDKKEKQ